MGENRLKLIPVYDKYAIMSCWGYVTEGVEEVLRHSSGDSSLSKVFNLIISGNLTLWIGFLDEAYQGFLTTRIDMNPFGDRSLWIVHLYSKSVVPEEIFFDCLSKVTDFAEGNNCKTIRAWSTRSKAFLRKLKDWKAGYTEMVYTFPPKK